MVLVDVQWVLNDSCVWRRTLTLSNHTLRCCSFKCFLFISLLVDDVTNSGCTLALGLCAYLTLCWWQSWRRRWQMWRWWSRKSCWWQQQLVFNRFTFLHSLHLHLHRWLRFSCGLSLRLEQAALIKLSGRSQAVFRNKHLSPHCKHTNVFQLRLQLFVQLAHEAFTAGAALGAQFPFHLKVNFANMTYSTFY